MNYSKPLMSITELVRENNFPRASLYDAAYHVLAYKYITSTRGGGKILFDTAEFEKVRHIVMRGEREDDTPHRRQHRKWR